VIYLGSLFPLPKLCLQLLTFELANRLITQSNELRDLFFELLAIGRRLYVGIIRFDHGLTINAVTGDRPSVTP
jgi:hypothetical protein